MIDVTKDEVIGSQAVRTATTEAHHAVEQALGLPGVIQTLDDYRRWLIRSFAFYRQLEERLAQFGDWAAWDIEIRELGQAASLARDLHALGGDIVSIDSAPFEKLPPLKSFAEALGALYVLEGSKLGGRYILHDLAQRLPRELHRADAFFTGYGKETSTRWGAFKSSLDRYCKACPEQLPSVIAGANATFTAIQFWMSPIVGKEIQ